MAFKTTRRIRFGEVDHASIVYYPEFFRYYHEAFEDLFNECFSKSYRDLIEHDRLGFPTVHVENDYFHPVRFGDELTLEVAVKEIRNRSVVLRTTTWLNATEKCSEGFITVVAVNMNTFKSMDIPPAVRRFFADHLDPV